MTLNIMEDKREIERIEIFSQCANDIISYSTRGSHDLKIIPYHENGETAYIIWFAIREKGQIIARINSKYVQIVEYKKETKC